MPKIIPIFGILLLLQILSGDVRSCEVLAKIKAETTNAFIFELSMPDAFKEQIEFNGPGQKEILIKAQDCATKPWKLLTMIRDEAGNLTVVEEAYTKLDGIGEVTIQIGDELQPQLKQRVGVACAEATLNLCL
ncbi:hypothetical protein niasHT_024616 [Heterodera trifolii]|uniref:Uncharacterized protein n=1 Tax=Heterodera trifolii TaxID=157864 RepID=A0ABD2K7I7_9BILA